MRDPQLLALFLAVVALILAGVAAAVLAARLAEAERRLGSLETDCRIRAAHAAHLRARLAETLADPVEPPRGRTVSEMLGLPPGKRPPPPAGPTGPRP